MQSKANSPAGKLESKIERVLDGLACAAVRLNLLYPAFDAEALATMPFKRPTTVVTDTSGVAQGGLDFIARYLHPLARVKVPAVVHMEIVNQSDRFLAQRRAVKSNVASALLEHVLSQGGQRVLLRLELRPETEVERSAVFGDPLRSAFKADVEEEWRELNMSVPLRSYCDRLILEATRQHQAIAAPGHPVRLLTSDQGLARMAMAEGIVPIFFRSVRSEDLFGQLLTGTLFHPFDGRLFRVPLATVLWEFATAFGSATLRASDGAAFVQVTALDEQLSWAPFHSRGDLLWVRSGGIGRSDESSTKLLPAPPKQDRESLEVVARDLEGGGRSGYRFNVQNMFDLVIELSRNSTLPASRAWSAARTTERGLKDYRLFLASGGFITVARGELTASDRVFSLAAALQSRDHRALQAALKQVPSFEHTARALTNGGRWDARQTREMLGRAAQTYQALAEVTCIAAPIGEELLVATPNDPTPTAFADFAERAFQAALQGQGLASAGEWLERLILDFGVHPVIARERLQEAVAAGLLAISAEGSTLDTRHDDHAVRVLELERGRPIVRLAHLYRGDFLFRDRASSSIKITRTAQ
jgi:hypothetical protein